VSDDGKRSAVTGCDWCGEPAVARVREPDRHFCAAHFTGFFEERVASTIQKEDMIKPGDRIALALSGGKDSTALILVLSRLLPAYENVHPVAITIDEGIAGYRDETVRAANELTARLGIEHHTVSFSDLFGDNLDTLLAGREREACTVCGILRKKALAVAAERYGATTIATGHNLDDEAAVLMQNTLHWQTGYLARQAPVLDERPPEACGTRGGLARKVKPFVRLYEREAAAYALIRGLDYIYDECPFAKGSTTNFYKELLNQLELTSPGAKQQFYLQFLRARDGGRATFAESGDLALQPCARCGQPTTAGGLCAFCRLWE
jgi:uncharacterized protein (TIGR00269 family)